MLSGSDPETSQVSADESTGRDRERSVSLRRSHTAELTADERARTRAFLDEAFDGDFSDDDWEHALGGVHILLHEDGELVGHAAVVQRRLVLGRDAVRTGYVEAVAVRGDRRGRGRGGELMAAAELVVQNAYDLGALSASEQAARLYQRRGWLRWRGPTWTLSPDGPVRTEDEDGGVYVLPTPTSPRLDPSDAIACDWRPGDVW
jgi:aminoglycoside 2'-N-acetyltransferase I